MLVLLSLFSFTLFFMSDNVSTAAATAEVAAAVAERVRRPERSADEMQPPAEPSEKRHASQKWRTHGLVEAPAGGNNKARKKQKLGPFQAATREAAEQMRDQAVDAWLHEPERKKRKTLGSSSSEPMMQAEPALRSTRAAAPREPGTFKAANILGGSAPGRRAGPGCATRSTRCLRSRASPDGLPARSPPTAHPC